MSELAPLLGADYDTAVDGEYIVIFKSEVSEDVVKLHKEKIKKILASDASKPAVTTTSEPAASEPAVTTASEPAVKTASEPAVTTDSEPAVMTASEPAVTTASEPAEMTASMIPAAMPPTQSASENFAKFKFESDFKIKSEWDMGKDFRGYAGVLSDQHVEYIRGLNEVEYVEQNQVMEAAVPQRNAPWGLERTTKCDLFQMNDTYEYNPQAGFGVTIFVIDSGVDGTHPAFGGRVVKGDTNTPIGDSRAHGTHVAGIAIADTYGLARSAKVIDVRVSDENNKLYSNKLIDGIDYVQKNLETKSVVNISLEGCASKDKDMQQSKAVHAEQEGSDSKDKDMQQSKAVHAEQRRAVNGAVRAVNGAVNKLVKFGVHVVVAAGNGDRNADTVFPASAELAITVAASDIKDQRYNRSNYGPCVDIIAPGANIQSTLPNNRVGFYSGTSMAAPHVSGVIATILSLTDEYDNPDEMKKYLKKIASKNKIVGFPPYPATDNDLLYYACDRLN